MHNIKDSLWTICFVFAGDYHPAMDNGLPIVFASFEEALKELDSDPKFYDTDCIICQLSDVENKIVWGS